MELNLCLLKQRNALNIESVYLVLKNRCMYNINVTFTQLASKLSTSHITCSDAFLDIE